MIYTNITSRTYSVTQEVVRELCRDSFDYAVDEDIAGIEPPCAMIVAYNRGGDIGPDPNNLTLDTRNTKSRWNKAVISILLGKVPAQQQEPYPTLLTVSDNYITDLLNMHVRNLVTAWNRSQSREGKTAVDTANRIVEMQEETQKQDHKHKQIYDVSFQTSRCFAYLWLNIL